MKKFFFALLFMLSGLWSVMATQLSGEVKFTYYGSENAMSSGTVSLNQGGKILYQTDIVSSYDSELSRAVARYLFEDIQDGTYTLVMYGQGYGKVWSYTQEITIGETDQVLDIMGIEDPTRVFMTVTTRVGPYSYTAIEGVEVICTDGENSITEFTDSYGNVSLLCDTVTLYTLSFHKEGYKDTSFQTKAAEYNIYSGTINPKYIVVYMTEDLGEQIPVSGTLRLNGSDELLTMNSLQIGITSSMGKNYTSYVVDGEYSFPSVSTGPASYFIHDNQTGTVSKDYTITSPQDGKVNIENTSGGEFIQEVHFERSAATVSGILVNEGSGQPIRMQAKIYVEGLNDTVTSDYSGKFNFGGIPEGSHTLHILAQGMEEETRTFEVDFSSISVGEKLDLGNIVMKAIAVDITFWGRLYYYDASYTTVYVDHARVELLSSDGTVSLDTTYTDNQGYFESKCTGYLNTSYLIKVTHDAIEDANATVTASSNRVDVSRQIYLQMRQPDLYPVQLYPVQNVQAVKVEGKREVSLTWEYHPEIIEGIDNIYTLGSIRIYRKQSMAEAYGESVGAIIPSVGELPTQFTDTSVMLDSTYFYQIELQYRMPTSSSSVYTHWNDSIMVTVTDYYQLSLSTNDAEAGTVEGEGSFKSGSEVEILAKANEGFEFAAFVSGSDTLSKQTPYRFEILSDTSILAVFKKIVDPDPDPEPDPDTVFYMVSLSANPSTAGDVTGEGKFEENTKVTVKAEAKEGYRFVAWTSGSDTIAKEEEFSFTLICDTALTAHFVQITGVESMEKNNWNCYVENGEIVISNQNARGIYQIFNLEGKLLYQGTLSSQLQRIPVRESGILLIRYKNQTGCSVRKVVKP